MRGSQQGGTREREVRRLFSSPYVCLAVERCVTRPKVSELQQMEAQAGRGELNIGGVETFPYIF